MIIDSLTHVTPDGRWFSTCYEASESRLLKEMDEVGVEKAVVIALAGYIENDFVAQVCSRHRDRLIPGASINPVAYSSREEASAGIKSLLSDGRFAVLKLHPRFNHYDPLNPICTAVIEEIAKAGSKLPIWIDTYLYYRGGRLIKPPIDTFHELVGRFPSLNFVLVHGCGVDILRLSQAVRDCPNTFIDISYTIHQYKGSSTELDLKYLLQTFNKRMVFGSDFPEVSLRETLDDFNALTLDLNPEVRNRILGNNLKGLLGI